MDDFSRRMVRTGDESWTAPAERQIPARVRWRLSQKGNPYATYEGRTVSVYLDRRSACFTFSLVLPDAPNFWRRADETFESEEDAKTAALAALMRASVRDDSALGRVDNQSIHEPVDSAQDPHDAQQHNEPVVRRIRL